MLLTSAASSAPPAPPPEFKTLIDEGHVQFDFYDPSLTRYERPGLTQFYAQYDWNFRFEIRTRRQRDALRVTVLPRLERIEMVLNHVIHLPKSYDNDALFGRALVVHEFDHVAISTDPRPRRLMEHLTRTLKAVEHVVPLDEKIHEELARSLVNDELMRRQSAVNQLIEFNNRRLDQLSNFGNRELENRRQFFITLFLPENLKEAEFPYLDEVAGLVRQPDYANVALARKKALQPKAGAAREPPLDP
jgi:hypothetical protein